MLKIGEVIMAVDFEEILYLFEVISPKKTGLGLLHALQSQYHTIQTGIWAMDKVFSIKAKNYQY